MNQITIGLAGHIDHGKTSLVESLTGKNTDNLKEEIKRGMTIDIGFAHFNKSILFITIKTDLTLNKFKISRCSIV